MEGKFSRSVNFILLFVIIFVQYGFANITLKDVEIAIIQKNYEQAKQMSEDLLSKEPVDKISNELNYYLGLCNLRLGQYSKACKIFNQLTKNQIDDQLRDKAYLGIFDSSYIGGKYKKAHLSINRLLKISPKSEFLSLIYLKLGRVNLKLANWSEAKKYLEKITNEFPESLEGHTARQLLEEKQYFAVQVGAFIEQQRAERLAAELQQKGEYAYVIETIDQDSRTFYRVRVGQLVSLGKAQKLKKKLSKEGYLTLIYP